MSKSIQLPLNTQCFLCDSFYVQAQEPYFIYKCFCCMEYTPYCFSCELKIQKLFGCGNFFKCVHCKKLTNALDKIKISSPNQSINVNTVSQQLSMNNTYFKTPIKPFLENNVPISSILEERKDNINNNCDNKKMISNFINEFKLINLINSNKNDTISQIGQIKNPENKSNFINHTISLNRDNNNNNSHDIPSFPKRALISSNSVNNFGKKNDYSLLKSRVRISRKFRLNDTFLGKKRDDSNTNDDYKGYNKSKDNLRDKLSSTNKNMFGTTKPKKIITKMSRLYKSGINTNTNSLSNRSIDLNNNLNNFFNYNGSFGISSMNNENKFNSSLFSNQSGTFGQGLNTINGTTTPHKIFINDQDQYF